MVCCNEYQQTNILVSHRSIPMIVAYPPPGELEETMARSFTRCANFRSLLSKADCPQALKNCEPMFCKLSNPQLWNTLITDIGSFSERDDETEDVNIPEHSTLIPVDVYSTLRTSFGFSPPRHAEMLSHLTIKGAVFAVASKHLGNSHVLISSADDSLPIPAQVHSILCIRKSNAIETLIAVLYYKPVQVAVDPYTQYPTL